MTCSRLPYSCFSLWRRADGGPEFWLRQQLVLAFGSPFGSLALRERLPSGIARRHLGMREPVRYLYCRMVRGTGGRRQARTAKLLQTGEYAQNKKNGRSHRTQKRPRRQDPLYD